MESAIKVGRILLRIGFVVTVTALAWFHLAASIMFVCAIVLLVVSGKLESLVEFSFGPLKAKIERNLSESEELIENLRKLALVQARAANAACVNTGRFASGDDWIFQSVKRVEDALTQIGMGQDDLKQAKHDFVRLTIKDAGAAALGSGIIPLALGDDAVREWKGVDRSDPDAVEAYLSKWDVLNEERSTRLNDMRWMLEHQDVRDSEQYMRAHTAVEWDAKSR